MTFSVIGKGHAPSSEGPPIPWPPSYRQKATPSRSFYACLPGPGVPAWVSEPPYGFLSYGSLPGFLGPGFPAWLPDAKTSCLASWARTFPPGFLGQDFPSWPPSPGLSRLGQDFPACLLGQDFPAWLPGPGPLLPA